MRGLAYYSDFIVETNLNFKVTNNKGKEIELGASVQEEPMLNLFQDLEELMFLGQELVLELIDYYLH